MGMDFGEAAMGLDGMAKVFNGTFRNLYCSQLGLYYFLTASSTSAAAVLGEPFFIMDDSSISGMMHNT